MNTLALYHRPQSEWSFPADENTQILRFRAAKDDLKSVKIVLKYKYNEKRIGVFPMAKRFSDTEFDYFEAAVPTDRGRRVYYFELTDACGTAMLYTDIGAKAPGALSDAYFPHFQIPFLSDSDIHRVPDKFLGTVIYQIFPDRFYTKNPKLDWKKPPRGNEFYGGELWGAAEKLGYIKELGMNAVYLTPINPSHTNHHYDVEDYYRVADDLGGDEAFRAFVERAHALGIKVIIDGVFNHCSALNPMFRDVAEKGKGSEYYDWFLIDGDKPDIKKCNYETFAWNVGYMPKLNCDNAKVVDFVCDVAAYWINKFGVDAWRLDVGDDVAPALWREVKKAVKSADNNAILIGEDWMDPAAFLSGDTFDGVMNYGFARAARDYLAYKTADAVGAAERLIRTYLKTSAPAAKMMMNLIGSHDTHRFFSLCGGDEFMHRAALAMMFFYDGMPTVYYGDELPMTGEHDPDCRKGFEWDRVGGETSALVKRLAAIRTEDKTSVMTDIESDNGVLVMGRAGKQTHTLFINATGGDIVTARHGTVPARTVLIDGQ